MPRVDVEERRAYGRRYMKEYRKKYPDKVKASMRDFWKKRTPEQKRNHTLRYRYGITSEEFTRLLNSQGGYCRICREVRFYKNKAAKNPKLNLYVDHCHKTGVVRGILCARCNTLVGFIECNKRLLGKINRYLQRGGGGRG